MPKFRYTADEPRTFPHVPVELDQDGMPVAFAGFDLAPGDVIEAATNPDPTRFAEVERAKKATQAAHNAG